MNDLLSVNISWLGILVSGLALFVLGGLWYTLLFGKGIVAAVLIQLYQFEGRTIRHLMINVGYMLVGFTAIGAILGAFQAA